MPIQNRVHAELVIHVLTRLRTRTTQNVRLIFRDSVRTWAPHQRHKQIRRAHLYRTEEPDNISMTQAKGGNDKPRPEPPCAESSSIPPTLSICNHSITSFLSIVNPLARHLTLQAHHQ